MYYETRKDNKTNKKTIPSYMSCPSMELESAWRLTQRINMLSYTGCSLPSTAYTAINITTQLQYFTSGRLASSTDINIRYTKYISPPAVLTRNTSLQTVTYNIIGSPGHSLVPHNIGEATVGTGESIPDPCRRRRECQVHETEFRVKKTKTNLFITVPHSWRLGWAATSSFLILGGLLRDPKWTKRRRAKDSLYQK